jgi:hypothetical protein
VALIGRGTLVMGLSQPSVEETFQVLHDPSAPPSPSGSARISINLGRLRRLPVTAVLMERLPQSVRLWVDAVEIAKATLTPGDSGLDIQGIVSFSSGVLGQ